MHVRNPALRLLPVVCAAAFASSASAQTLLYSKNGTIDYERFGASVASTGDVNNDGKPDFVIGAPEDGNIFTLGKGRVRVYSGNGGGVLYNLTGAVTGDAFGFSVAGAGDVNNDGFKDFVVGAPLAGTGGSNAGRVFVYSGQTGLVIAALQFTGIATGDNLGWSVAGAGDVNNDGFDDVIAGAPAHAAGGSNRGMARVYSGQNGSILRTILGTSNNSRLGNSVAGVGDVNNDGFDDFVVGSLLAGAKVYSGQTGNVLHTFTAPTIDDRLGAAVAGAGRVDADLVPDIIVGAPQDSGIGGGASGYAKVYSGATGAVLLTLNGIGVGDRFGISVAGARDLDGDGRSELIVGADQVSISGSGYARVFNAVGGATMYTFNGSGSGERFGASVDGLGDTNVDGLDEVIIGAPNRLNGPLLTGTVQVWQEGPVCPPPTNYCSATNNSTGGPASIASSGSTSIAANDFVLLVSGAPPNKFALFIYGQNQASLPFGNGLRCVGSPFARLPSTVTDTNGEVVYPINYNALPVAMPITAGSVMNFQLYFRDPPAGGANFNLTDGRQATFCP